MVNICYYGVRRTTLINEPVEKLVVRDRDCGRDRERRKVRGRGRIVPARDEAQAKDIPIGESLLALQVKIEKNMKIEVEENVEAEKGAQEGTT